MANTYPFNHECDWQGPFYMWTSIDTDSKPPADCKPCFYCYICGATKPAVNAPITERKNDHPL